LVSGQINPDWDCPQDNYMLTSSKIDILLVRFTPLTTINQPDAMTDYDETYWSHVYDRIKNSEVDSKPPSDPLGKLKRIAGIASRPISSIV
jgi:hypothetical protein